MTRRALEEQPEVAVDETAWAAAIARVLGAAAKAGDAPRLEDLRSAELWLATAVATGDPKAVSTFETMFLPEVDRALRRLSLAPDAVVELRQQVRIHLLVADPGSNPRIMQYTGRGSLAGWVRTVAARQALSARRSNKPISPIEDVPELALRDTPEFSCLRHEHRTLFVSKLKEAFRGLDQHGRTLLRLRYASGMTAVALARTYGVHESTMSRRLANARKQMADNFERLVAASLGSPAALPEFLAVMQSRLDASLQSLFATQPPAQDNDGPPADA